MQTFKKLAGSIREYKIQSLLSPLLIIFEVLIECYIPFLTSKLIDSIENGCDLSQIGRQGLILILMAVLSLSCGAGAGYFCSVASCGFAKNIRHDLFYKVQTYSFSNIDRFSTSGLVTRLTTDVTNIQNAYMMLIRGAFRSPLMLIFSVVMTLKTCGKMAAVFVVMVPFLLFAVFGILKRVIPIFNRIFKRYDALNESVQENVSGIRAVKSFVRESFEQEKFNIASDNVCKDFTGAEKIMALTSPVIQAASYTVMLFACVFGAKIIIKSTGTELTVGGLSAVLTYGMQVLVSLTFLSMTLVMIMMSLASARRIAEVLDEESDIQNPDSPVTEIPDGSVDFENVSFSYSKDAKKKTLENIDIHIASGETIGMLGATGSSKTTLIQLISRLYDVTDGCVKVGGTDVRDYDLEKLRNSVSVVLQKNLLFSGTIKDNLRWGKLDASDEEIEHVCKLAQADEFIENMPEKYDTYIEQGGTNVSGGQKQRLCIARALLKSPKVLILDDSTSAVDTKTDALIRKAFREEIPDITKIIIAQRISSIMDADRILVLDDGKTVAFGTHDELMKSCNIYREVYESQTGAGDFDE